MYGIYMSMRRSIKKNFPRQFFFYKKFFALFFFLPCHFLFFPQKCTKKLKFPDIAYQKNKRINRNVNL